MSENKERDACRLGWEEYDGSAYCFAHGRFVAYAAGERQCPNTAPGDQS